MVMMKIGGMRLVWVIVSRIERQPASFDCRTGEVEISVSVGVRCRVEALWVQRWSALPGAALERAVGPWSRSNKLLRDRCDRSLRANAGGCVGVPTQEWRRYRAGTCAEQRHAAAAHPSRQYEASKRIGHGRANPAVTAAQRLYRL